MMPSNVLRRFFDFRPRLFLRVKNGSTRRHCSSVSDKRGRYSDGILTFLPCRRRPAGRQSPAICNCQSPAGSLLSRKTGSGAPSNGSGAADEAPISRGSVARFQRGLPKPDDRFGIAAPPVRVPLAPPDRRKAESSCKHRRPRSMCANRTGKTEPHWAAPSTVGRTAPGSTPGNLLGVYVVLPFLYDPLHAQNTPL